MISLELHDSREHPAWTGGSCRAAFSSAEGVRGRPANTEMPGTG
jgi:hypothetical protein